MSNKKKNVKKASAQKTTRQPASSSQSLTKSAKVASTGARKPARKPVKKGILSNPMTLTLIGLAVVAAVVVIVILVTREPDYVNSLPDTISVDDAYQKYQAGTFVLDVRTQEEWDEFRVPNTTLIPLDELESRLNELPSDQEIVVICRSGNRSQDGRNILLKNGFSAVTSVEGGLKSWVAAGYPVEGTPPE